MASPASYVITPAELQSLRERLASLGIVSLSPQQQQQQQLAQRRPSHQRTRSRSGSEGPFSQPVSGVQSSAPSRPTSPSAIFPPSRTANFWKDDDMLPLTSRQAIRAGAMGLTIGWAFDALLPLIMRRKSAWEALKGLTAKVPVRMASALWLYVFLYRTLLQFLHRVRAQLLARAARSPSSITAAAARNASLSEAKPYRALDEIDHAQPGGSSVNKAAEAEEEEGAEQSLRTRAYLRFWRMLRSPMLPPFLAAIAASIPALPMLPSAPFPRRSLAVYVFTQSIRWAFLEARRSDAKAVRYIPTWIGGALWYAVGNAQLLYAFLFHPDCFPTGYGKFILSRSNGYAPQRPQHLPASISWPSQRVIVDHIAQLSTPTRTSPAFPSFSSPLLSALTPSPYPTTDFLSINSVLDYGPAHPAHSSLVCAIMHPAEPSCKRNATEFWKREWWGAARFVAGFAALSNVLAWKKLAKDPETAIFRFLLATIQGATVITGSISTAWSLVCFFQHYLPRSFIPRYRYFLNGLLSAVWILAVPTRRRSELGNYVGRLSLQSSWDLAVKKKKVKPIKNGDLLLMALGLATITALFEERPRALTPAIRSALARVTGPRQGGIGVPSSVDPGLLNAAAKAAAASGAESGGKPKRSTRGFSMTSVWPR